MTKKINTIDLQKINYSVKCLQDAMQKVDQVFEDIFIHAEINEEEPIFDNHVYEQLRSMSSELSELSHYIKSKYGDSDRVINKLKLFKSRDIDLEEPQKSSKRMEMDIPLKNKNMLYDNTTEENKISEELNKLQRKLPKWRSSPSQLNHRILQGFFDLEKNDEPVYVEELAKHCKEKFDINERSFYANLMQLKSISPKNHGKIFSISTDQQITLWEKAEKIILESWNN